MLQCGAVWCSVLQCAADPSAARLVGIAVSFQMFTLFGGIFLLNTLWTLLCRDFSVECVIGSLVYVIGLYCINARLFYVRFRALL